MDIGGSASTRPVGIWCILAGPKYIQLLPHPFIFIYATMYDASHIFVYEAERRQRFLGVRDLEVEHEFDFKS